MMKYNSQIEAMSEFTVENSDRNDDFIKSCIFTIRGVQVMLDRDLAVLYGVSTSRLNEQVKRNIRRFPSSFMFQLTDDELASWKNWISQNATSNLASTLKMGIRRRPYAFTEHGVIMLASVLKSDIAADLSIRITATFVSMRKMLSSMEPVLARIVEVERRQLEEISSRIHDQQRNDERFETIFKAMDGGDFPPQKVFFEGKHYEAHSFAKKLVRKAEKTIVLVDGYCDEVTLDILSQKKGGVSVVVATAQKMIDTHLTPVAVAKFNKQNPTLAVKAVGTFHDRFLILDGKELYHFGASLNNLGRHYCAVTKMDSMFISSIKERI